MSDDAIRRALAALARSSGTDSGTDDAGPAAGRRGSFRETIERATAALDDLDEAAAFVDDEGLDELELAVERAERSVSACTDDGRRALATFREFSEAAAGNHFHPGHGTSLGGDDIAPSK